MNLSNTRTFLPFSSLITPKEKPSTSLTLSALSRPTGDCISCQTCGSVASEMPPIATNELDAMTKESALACMAPGLFLLSKELGEDRWTYRNHRTQGWRQKSVVYNTVPGAWALHSPAQELLPSSSRTSQTYLLRSHLQRVLAHLLLYLPTAITGEIRG